MARWLTCKRPCLSPANAEVDDLELAGLVSRVLWRLPRPWRHTCLRRAVVLYYLLRKAGRPVELVIGVKHDPEGAVSAHAWLVRDGKPYLENDLEHPSRFNEIARFPEQGQL